jgi:hypothetical protein
MNVVATTRRRCDFDKFLYASVGDDHNGMPLTVLSALARMNVDPWEEASRLTQLPQESAVTHLASLLGALGNAPLANGDSARIAAPLIALLPYPRHRASPMFKAFAQAAPTVPPAVVYTLLSVLTYLIFMLLSQWMMTSSQAPRMQAASASAPPITSPSAPPANDGPKRAFK